MKNKEQIKAEIERIADEILKSQEENMPFKYAFRMGRAAGLSWTLKD